MEAEKCEFVGYEALIEKLNERFGDWLVTGDETVVFLATPLGRMRLLAPEEDEDKDDWVIMIDAYDQSTPLRVPVTSWSTPEDQEGDGANFYIAHHSVGDTYPALHEGFEALQVGELETVINPLILEEAGFVREALVRLKPDDLKKLAQAWGVSKLVADTLEPVDLITLLVSMRRP